MFYTYYCPLCKKEVEFMHGMLEEPGFFCEDDNTKMKKRVTGGVGVIYHGNGWPRKGTGTTDSVKHMYVHDLVAAVPTGENNERRS